MAQLTDADEVQEIVGRVISDYDTTHGHLREARIKCLFRKGAWKSKGKIVPSKTCKTNDREEFLTGFDFVIIVNEAWWRFVTPEQRLARIDHALCHCVQSGEEDGAPVWARADHDAAEFISVISRHGLYMDDIKELGKAVQQTINFGPVDGVESVTFKAGDEEATLKAVN